MKRTCAHSKRKKCQCEVDKSKRTAFMQRRWHDACQTAHLHVAQLLLLVTTSRVEGRIHSKSWLVGLNSLESTAGTFLETKFRYNYLITSGNLLRLTDRPCSIRSF